MILAAEGINHAYGDQRVLEKVEVIDGLRLDWEGMPSEQTEVIIYYRYLGLPLRHAVTSIWAIP